MDTTALAWHTSDFTPTDGNNWWCGDETVGGYLDSWVQYLDTPSFTVPANGSMSADMRWAIEAPAGAVIAGTCTDGWDQANVQISTDGGTNWMVIEGDDPYDFECGYGTVYNGYDGAPGWGGTAGDLRPTGAAAGAPAALASRPPHHTPDRRRRVSPGRRCLLCGRPDYRWRLPAALGWPQPGGDVRRPGLCRPDAGAAGSHRLAVPLSVATAQHRTDQRARRVCEARRISPNRARVRGSLFDRCGQELRPRAS